MNEVKGPRRLAKAIDMKMKQTERMAEMLAKIDHGMGKEIEAKCEELDELMRTQCGLSALNPLPMEQALQRFMRWSISQFARQAVLRERHMVLMNELHDEQLNMKRYLFDADEVPTKAEDEALAVEHAPPVIPNFMGIDGNQDGGPQGPR